MIPATAEIVVVGAGVIGVSTAYHLTKKGAKNVLVLDRGAIGRGQTHKSGGFIQTHWENIHEVRLIARAREIFSRWSEEIGGDCGFSRTGYLHVTGPEKEPAVRAVHQMLLDEGLESHWLGPDEIRELQPLLVADDLSGAAYEPSSGWADPVRTTQSLAEAARRQGATIVEGTPVLQISHRSGRVIGVETGAGFVSCPNVVLAIGPWTHALHPEPRIHLPLRIERGQVCYFDRPEGLPHREVAFYDESTGLYTHASGETNLVGIDWNFEQVWGPDQYDRELDFRYSQAALRALGYRFPQLARSRLVNGVVGLYDFTPDGLPIFDGPLGIDGYFVAAGFSGAGFKSAPATGLGMAEIVLEGRATSVDLDYFRLSRFGQP